MRIVVLRCNGIGDYLMSTPALEALRTRFPAAEVTLLGARWHREFLRDRGAPVDDVVVLPHVPGLAGQPADSPPATELADVLATLRARRFDLAVQLHGGGARSNPLVRALGAGHAIGLRAPGAPALDATVPYRTYQPEVARYLEVVGLVGARGPGNYSLVEPTESERARAAELLGSDGRGWVALGPGAGDPRRRWPVDRFVEAATALAALGARVAVVGDAGDRDLATAVAAGAGTELLDLTGRTDLGVLTAVLQRCTVTVPNDSGPLHLARAVGTATVDLYWCGNAINAAPDTRTWHRPLLSFTVHCPECGADCSAAGNPHRSGAGCGHRPSFVGQITVPEVVEEAADLLAGDLGRSGPDGRDPLLVRERVRAVSDPFP